MYLYQVLFKNIVITCMNNVMSSKGFAYVSLFFGGHPDIFLGLVSVGWSLKDRHATQHDLVLMHTSDVPRRFLDILAKFWKLRLVHELPFDHLVTKGSRESLKRLFLKLRSFQLTQYRKVLFLDVDILIRGSLDELFNYHAPAGVLYDWKDVLTENAGKVLTGADLLDPATGELTCRVNAGVLLVVPDSDQFEKICAMAASWGCDGDKASCCPEEELLTRYFAAQDIGLTSLDLRWNLEMHRAWQVTKRDTDQAIILHFSCSAWKPFWTTWNLRPPWIVFEESCAWAKKQEFDDQYEFLASSTVEWYEVFMKCCEQCLGKGIDVLGVAWDKDPCRECHKHPGIYEGRGSFTNRFYCVLCWEKWGG